MKNYLLIALLTISCIHTSLLSEPQHPNSLPAYCYWIAGTLASATFTSAYFTYKAFKKWRAEENNFSELRDFLKEKGATVQEWSKYGYDGRDYREDNLEITPNPNWTKEEYTIGKEHMNKLKAAFYSRRDASSFFIDLLSCTTVAGLFTGIYFQQLLKELKYIK